MWKLGLLIIIMNVLFCHHAVSGGKLCFKYTKGTKVYPEILELPNAPKLSPTRHDSSITSFKLSSSKAHRSNRYIILEEELIEDLDGNEPVLLYNKGIHFEELKAIETIGITHSSIAELDIYSATIIYQTLFTHKYELDFLQYKKQLEVELNPELFKTDLLKIFKLRITLKEKGRFKIHLVIPVLF